MNKRKTFRNEIDEVSKERKYQIFEKEKVNVLREIKGYT